MQTHTNTKDSKWLLDRESDDIRGWPVHDDLGRTLGTVAELYVDPESANLSEIRLDDGRVLPAHGVIVGDHDLIAATMPALMPAPTRLAAIPAAPARVEVIPPAPAKVPMPAAPATRRADADLVVQRVDEELEIEKRRYDAGRVHVETHVVSKPFSRDLQLRDEHVIVDRSKVDRPLDAATAERYFQDETFEVTARAERPVVSKNAHVVEEIVIRKVARDREQTVRDTIRHMDVEITELRGNAALEAKAAPVEDTAAAARTMDPARSPAHDDNVAIPVISEGIEVGTRQVEAGGVRIATHVREVPVERKVMLHEERVIVERRAVDRPIRDVDDAYRDRAFDLAATSEEALVTKRAHVVEDIHLHMERKDRTQNVTGTVRHTEVEVSEQPGKPRS